MESETRQSGQEVVVAETSICPMGLSVCYDLRFPELSRLLTLMGAEILMSPSGWVQGDMKVEHWQTMVRARGLEGTARPTRRPGPRCSPRPAGVAAGRRAGRAGAGGGVPAGAAGAAQRGAGQAAQPP